MEKIETHKFYKGHPHPYDESLPSFAAINVAETSGDDGDHKLSCEFITVAPLSVPDQESRSYGWRLLVEQINILKEDTSEGLFPRVKKLAEERVKIAYISASQATRDTMVFSAGHAFRLNHEIAEEQFLALVGRCAFADPALVEGMIARSKSASFRDLVANLK